jgi:hypothetical protein
VKPAAKETMSRIWLASTHRDHPLRHHRPLPQEIHAVTAEGFILKLILSIFAYTLNQVIE